MLKLDGFVIKGGKKLKGQVRVSGSKNAALPCLFAALLSDQESVIENVPDLKDIRTAVALLGQLGRRTEFDGRRVVVKAQAHAGGRGKAGLIKLAETQAEAERQAAAILGQTFQGYRIQRLLVEQALEFAAEYYLAVTIDRTSKSPIMMFSTMGGVDIEEVAASHPDQISRLVVDLAYGPFDFELRRLIAGDPDAVGRTWLRGGEPELDRADRLAARHPVLSREVGQHRGDRAPELRSGRDARRGVRIVLAEIEPDRQPLGGVAPVPVRLQLDA